MKDAIKSIKIAVFFFAVIVFTLTGCKEEHTGGAATHIPPYVNGGEPQPFPDDIPEMSSELVRELEKVGAGNTPVLVLVDSKNGDIRILTNPKYERQPLGSKVDAAEINRVTAISIVDFKNNPGCQWVNISGSEVLFCEKRIR